MYSAEQWPSFAISFHNTCHEKNDTKSFEQNTLHQQCQWKKTNEEWKNFKAKVQ